MRVTKQTHLDFDYLDTIQKINKMQGSPRYLSKENLPGNKNPNSIISKDSILNNIPIKVRLIRAAELNPNINLGKIRNLNRNSKTLKKELEIQKDTKSLKKLEKKNINDTSSISNSTKKDEDKTNNDTNTKNIKNENDELTETNTLSPKSGQNYNQSDIYKLKKLLISPRNVEKETDSALNSNNIKTSKFNLQNPNENEDNFDVNTYNQNENKSKDIFLQNFAYNKPKKGNIIGNPYSLMTQKGYIKNSFNTETCEVKEYDNKSYVLSNNDNSSVCSSSVKVFNICNSPKIIKINKDKKIKSDINNSSSSNNIKINNNRSKISQKKENKNYGLNTYIQKNPNILISNRLNTSPFRIRNNSNSNNNSFNLNNNYNYNINFLNLSPKKEINPNLNYDNIDIKLDDLILFEERLSDISIALSN